MNWDIEKHIIFETMIGSHAYGTTDSKSDVDLRGVCIPPLSIMLGLLGKFEQKDGWEGKYEDRVIYNIHKFFEMLLSNNPTILEMLFITPTVKSSRYWDRIIENRSIFISKKTKHTFTGYAHAQLHRIRRHRGYLLNPLKTLPTRGEYGLPTNPSISYEQMSALLTLPLEVIHNDELREEAFREARYRQMKKEWDDYQSWKEGRNKERAKLEEEFGYDVKHASHLVRLMYEGEEVLKTGYITLPRPEAGLLVDIKNGKYSYDELLALVSDFDAEFENLYESSTLPYTPDYGKANSMYLDILDEYYSDGLLLL